MSREAGLTVQFQLPRSILDVQDVRALYEDYEIESQWQSTCSFLYFHSKYLWENFHYKAGLYTPTGPGINRL